MCPQDLWDVQVVVLCSVSALSVDGKVPCRFSLIEFCYTLLMNFSRSHNVVSEVDVAQLIWSLWQGSCKRIL